ncbi:MAG: glycoside hydrolase [Desulfurococcaceae archaeon]
MSAIIPHNIVDSLESYIVLDKPIYRFGSEAKIYVLLRNYSDSLREANIILYEHGVNKIYEKNVKIEPGSSVALDYEYCVGENSGINDIALVINGKIRDKIYYIVGDPSTRSPIYSTIVWHHHQAPNYDSNSRIHSPWAYIYVWGDHLKPYGRGPYHFHATILSKHTSFKTTYNLSPSLLKQWLMLINNGVEMSDGKVIDRNSPEAKLVEETLRMYRESVRRKQIDVLTSIYAHTIGGFLTDALDLDDIVRDEIAYGLKITKEAIGDYYEPEGIWTPEMAFSMRLVQIYSDLGLKYTVLDEKHHYTNSTGDKSTPFKPYILIDRATGKHITVFFRDSELSNTLSFRNNFVSEIHAWRNAYEFAFLLAKKWLDPGVETHIIALDGENWMVFSKNPPLTAYFMEKLVQYLVAIDHVGFIKLSTLREIYRSIPARHVLTNIKTNSWLGGFNKWFGEVPEHKAMWIRVAETIRLLRAYEKMINGRDEYSEEARWALWHALDSDYWWAEFWLPKVILNWLTLANDKLQNRLQLVRLRKISILGDLIEDSESKILVEIENGLDKDVSVILNINGSFEAIGGSYIHIHMKPKSIYSREVLLKPIKTGKCLIIASLISNNYVIDLKAIESVVYPSIRNIS